MPAINVARTDTFEVQRQKINQIGDILSNISAGGSDLQTGNLKLGDGTRTTPSLSFISDSSLGIYKADTKTLGYVVDGKKLVDFSPSGIYSFKDLIVQQRVLTTDGLSILNNGSNYDAGLYSDIPLIGGTGDGAVVDVGVTAFVGNVISEGFGYNSGFYSDITLNGGSGSGAVASFIVPSVEGEITNPGSGYLYDEINFGFYADVPLTNISGTGTGATAFITISEDGTITDCGIAESGSGYNQNDILSVNNSDVGGQGSGFQFQVTSTPGKITDFEFFEKGTGYQIGNTLSLPGSVTGVSTTLDNTTQLISVSSVQNIFIGSTVVQTGGTGILASGTTVSSVDSELNTISLSIQPDQSGSATLSFIPPYGTPSSNFSFEVTNVGEIETVSITEGGNGYSLGDELTFNPSNLTEVITYPVTVKDVREISFVGSVSTASFSVGDFLKVKDGEVLGISVVSSTTTVPEASYTNVPSTTNGSGSGATFDVQRDEFGSISLISVNSPGYFYSDGDTIIISGSTVGGATPADNIELLASGVSSTDPTEVYKINSSGGNITSIILENDSFSVLDSGTILIESGTSSPDYVIDTVSSMQHRFLIDVGSGPEFTPSFSLYSGSVYAFDLSDASNAGHPLYLSKFRDGIWSPSLIENISTSLLTTTNDIVVNDSTGILPGMAVEVSSGSGVLLVDTTVDSVDGNTITLSNAPLSSGPVVLRFFGTEYTDGVTRTDSLLTIQVNETTPSLYYYCLNHENMGGDDNEEGTITIDLNNPKVFGSGFLLTVAELQSTDIIVGDIETGDFSAVKFVGQQAELEQASVTGSLNAPTIIGDSVSASSITSTSNLSISATDVNVSGNFNIGSNIQVTASSGNITTAGTLKTTGSLNVDDILTINNNSISTTSGNDLLLTPPTGKIAQVTGTTAFAIPAGNTLQRPSPPVNEGDGYIRFNTETNQYEGYSSSTQSWSSLGGVRDLDGNTTILAEESIGANDNTLWFINDNVNTVRFTPNYQEFVNVKKIRSVNTSAPSYTTWTANTPVTAGQYLKYRTSIFEVISPGTTATSGSEPTDVSGDPFVNGSATLQYSTTATAPLTFDEISEVRIDPLGFTDLVVNGELRFSTNTISSTTNDIIIKPTGSQKTVIKGTSSLVVPVGDNNSKGNPAQGSIRYSTTDSQFEGYNGAQWGGLGGVKDIDQDTKIEAETAPGNDEDILYFFNAGNNTLRLTTTGLLFDTIDTIESSGSGNLNLNASLVTFNNLETSIDNSSSTVTKISTTKDNLDFALATGIYNDHLLKLTDTGDVIYNLGFGTGTPNNLTVLNNTLTNFEIKHTKVNTSRLDLEKGTTNSGNATVYTPSTELSAKVFVTAHNITTGDKEIVEYFITDNGTDILFTDSNNIKTGEELFSSVFDFDPLNNVRISITLGSELTVSDQVEVTIIKTITKR